MKHVRDMMTANPAYCTPDTPIVEVANLMLQNDCGEIPVVESQGSLIPVGVITDRDIVCRCIAQRKNPLDIPVSECMSSPAITVTPDTRADECCHAMARHAIRRVPVVDKNGFLCGIVAQADIARFLTVEQKVEFLERISSPSEEGFKKVA